MNKKLVLVLTSLFGLVSMMFNSKSSIVMAEKKPDQPPPMVTCYAPMPPKEEMKKENEQLKKDQQNKLKKLNEEGKISDKTVETIQGKETIEVLGEQPPKKEKEDNFSAVQDLLEGDNSEDDLPMDEIRRMQDED